MMIKKVSLSLVSNPRPLDVIASTAEKVWHTVSFSDFLLFERSNLFSIQFSEKIPIFRIVMETVMIHDFIVFLVATILKMIQDFLTQDIKIPEMFQNTTVIDKSCLKIATIPNIAIMNGFLIDKRIVSEIQIMILDGTRIQPCVYFGFISISKVEV